MLWIIIFIALTAFDLRDSFVPKKMAFKPIMTGNPVHGSMRYLANYWYLVTLILFTGI